MLLVLPHDEVVRLEEQHLVDAEVAAPGDEVVHVVPGEEGAGRHVGAVDHVVLRDLPLGREPAAAACGWALRLQALLPLLLRQAPHVVGVLWGRERGSEWRCRRAGEAPRGRHWHWLLMDVVVINGLIVKGFIVFINGLIVFIKGSIMFINGLVVLCWQWPCSTS